MKIRKQGTGCLVQVESISQDDTEVWGYTEGQWIHLGSYPTPQVAHTIVRTIVTQSFSCLDTFQMPSDVNFNIAFH